VDAMARERDGASFVPEGRLLQDNGAMIAWTGLLMHRAGVRMEVKDTVIDQRFRTDEVEVVWR
jgi:N6-L-threonylcarbamoyladenine synthase